MIKLFVASTPVEASQAILSSFSTSISIEKIDKHSIKSLSHSQDSLFDEPTYFFIEDALLTKPEVVSIVEKELNIIGTISKNTQSSAAEVIHTNEIEIINVQPDNRAEPTPWKLVQSMLDNTHKINEDDLIYFSSNINNFRFFLNLLEKDLLRLMMVGIESPENVAELMNEKVDFKYDVAKRRLDAIDEKKLSRFIEILWKIESINTKEFDEESSKRAMISLGYI